MLIVDSLSHAFGAHRVLAGIYLSCAPGEIVGVVGENGCGKTTMLRSIFGSLAPDHIHLTVDDAHVATAYRTGVVAYQPQEPYLPRRLTVRRAAALALADRGARSEVTTDPEIAPYLSRRIRALSGGDQRYLEVLLAVHSGAPYVLLDEPFTELEPIRREPLSWTIRRAASGRGLGFVITDHAYRDVLAIADRVVVMRDGVLLPASCEDDLRRLGYTP